MTKKKIGIFFFFICISLILYFSLIKNKKDENIIESSKEEEILYNSNVIKNVNYTTKDAKGNEYIIMHLWEIDFNNNNIIFLTDVDPH